MPSWAPQLHEHINAEVVGGVLTNLADGMEYLTWTYFFRRLVVNPSYYELAENRYRHAGAVGKLRVTHTMSRVSCTCVPV